ncbi:MAG: PD40 domain-containing protein [Chloroflexi bacterium]|nr:PD40 domain-containing protein [Chloroflexota bacterium]
MSSIAYVDRLGFLNVLDGVGEASHRISAPDTYCTWPTWSPDGRTIAFSGYQSANGEDNELGIYFANLDGEDARQIYANDFDTGEIAPSTPHYSLWSPDGSKLAFVAQTSQGALTLFLHGPDSDAPPRRILSGGPLYCAWAPDSDSIFVHSFQEHYMIDVTNDFEMRQFPGSSTLYMAPSWNAQDGRAAIFLDADNNRQRLVVLGLREPEVKVVLEIPGIGACSWQPKSSALALVRDMRGRSGFYDGLWMLEPSEGTEDKIIEDPVLAFFWSPDGSKIAYVTTSETGQGSLRWAVHDIESGEVAHLVDFRPTQENLIIFMYFDQYNKSHSPWSPDGSQLLFAGELGHQQARTPLPDGESNRVYVVSSDGGGSAEEVASGFIACWGVGGLASTRG